MKKLNSILVCAGLVAAMLLTGCGAKVAQKDNTQKEQDQKVASFDSAVAVLEKVWGEFDEENKFPCYGGDITAPVDSAPGAVDVANTDVLSSVLLIPESIQSQVTDAASLVHFMNANSFTGAAVKVTGDQAAFIDTLKSEILGYEFMCGFPEKLVVVSVGDYVTYAFGDEMFVEAFESIAKNIDGAKVEVSQLFE